jgi:hypothetical protein
MSGTAAVLLFSVSAGAQAVAISYGYAYMGITSLALEYSGGFSGVSNSSFSNTSALVLGSPSGIDANGDSTDAAQAYVGVNAPLENDFTGKGKIDADYARADTRIISGAAAENLAEGFLSAPASTSSAQAEGDWFIARDFRTVDAGDLDVSLEAIVELLVELAETQEDGDGAIAEVNFAVTLTDLATSDRELWTPAELNTGLDLAVNDSLSDSFDVALNYTFFGLTSDSVYRVGITAAERVTLDLNEGTIPEPTTILLIALGLAGIGYQRRRGLAT